MQNGVGQIRWLSIFVGDLCSNLVVERCSKDDIDLNLGWLWWWFEFCVGQFEVGDYGSCSWGLHQGRGGEVRLLKALFKEGLVVVE